MKNEGNIDFRTTTRVALPKYRRRYTQRVVEMNRRLQYPIFQRGLGGFSSKFRILDRGYTGHEHLLDHNIINMNGRLYDPVVGQFMQADNFIQSPEDFISYNRYSYCLFNPFKYTDPSGEEPLSKWMVQLTNPSYIPVVQVEADGPKPRSESWTWTWSGPDALSGNGIPYSPVFSGCGGYTLSYSYSETNYGVSGNITNNTEGLARNWSVGTGSGGVYVTVLPSDHLNPVAIQKKVKTSQVIITVDDNFQAVDHYLFGDGSPVRIGQETTNSLLQSPEFLNQHKINISGKNKKLKDHFSVNMRKRVFHIGNTNVSYSIDPSNKIITYTLYVNDGFWDPDFIDEDYSYYFFGYKVPILQPDNKGPNLERLGGKPYDYIPTIILIHY